MTTPDPASAPRKHWLRSKTLHVNAIAAALVALEATTGVLQPHLPVDVYLIIAVVLPVLNAVLRVITHQGLTIHAARCDREH